MIITIGMLLICIGIYVVINFIDQSDDKNSLAIKYGAFYPAKIEYNQEYWRFLTANFVHVDFIHLFMNCYALYYLGGTFFERLLGTFPYIYLILVSGIASYIVTYLYSKKDVRYQNTITLGASGIFYGFLGAIVTLGVVFIAINVVFTLVDKSVSKTGHLGGFIGGVLAMLVLIGSGVCGY